VIELVGLSNAAASERHEPRRSTQLRLPVRPGDAALSRRLVGLIGSGASQDLDGSKHESDSLLATAWTAGIGQMESRGGHVLGGSSVARLSEYAERAGIGVGLRFRERAHRV